MNSSYVQCRNADNAMNSEHNVTLEFDGNNRSSCDMQMFTYKEDPEVLNVFPTTFIEA